MRISTGGIGRSCACILCCSCKQAVFCAYSFLCLFVFAAFPLLRRGLVEKLPEGLTLGDLEQQLFSMLDQFRINLTKVSVASEFEGFLDAATFNQKSKKDSSAGGRSQGEFFNA